MRPTRFVKSSELLRSIFEYCVPGRRKPWAVVGHGSKRRVVGDEKVVQNERHATMTLVFSASHANKPTRLAERDSSSAPRPMDSSSSSRERDQSRICVEHIDEWNKVKNNYTEALIETLNAKVGSAPSAERDALLAHLMQVRAADNAA